MTAAVSDGLPPAAPTRNPVLALLQRVGRSLMLPIAVLPAAALLLRLGQPDTLGADGLGQYAGLHWLNSVSDVLGQAGNAIFTWLPLLFAIGVAVGFARRSDGSTALAATVGYLVYHFVSMHLFYTVSAVPASIKGSVTAYVASTADGKPAPSLNLAASNPTYVLGGIIVGITAALLYQRFYRVKLPPYLAFFGGRRFVPIVTSGVCVVLGVVMTYVWIPVSAFINWLGNEAINNGAAGAGFFGVVNRALLPFGLHHIVNSIAWFTLGNYTGADGTVVHGDLTRFFAGDPHAGMFMTGFFPVMMFGLPAAALAITHCARPEKRKAVGGIMLAGALTSFLTGVTEPLEFSFLFVAPMLFGIHALLTGASLALMQALGAHDGFGFSAGAIDFGLNYTKATKPWLIIVVGLIYAVVYYAVFRFAITKFNIMTPGREPDDDGTAPGVREPVEGRSDAPIPVGRAPSQEPVRP